MVVYIKPYEVFEVDGHWFVFKLKSLTHQTAASEDADFLLAVKGQYELDADEGQIEALRRYRLIADAKWDEAAEHGRILSFYHNRRESSRPQLMELFVSQSCNMGCAYCYGSDGTYHQQGLMDFSTAKRAMDWLHGSSGDSNDVSIVFFGGEPLMNFEVIRQSVEYAESLFGAGRATYGMATNMALMTDEYLDYFASLPKFFLLVSIDGPREIHNRQRPLLDGRDSYDVCSERIAAALRRGIHCTGRATVYAGTDRAAVVAEMKELGLPLWQLTPVSGCASDGIRRDDAARLNELWIDTMPKQAVEFIAAIKRRDREAADALMADDDLRRLIIEGAGGAEIPKGILGCAAGRSQFAVSASGDLYPCHRFVGMDEFCFGNLVRGTRRDGWHELAGGRFAHNTECAKCFLRYGCGGECYYQCYSDGPKKSIYAMPEYFCEFTRMRTRLKIYISHMLDAGDKRWYFTREFARPV